MLHMCYIMFQNNFKYIISSLNTYKILISVIGKRFLPELHKFLAKTDPMRVYILHKVYCLHVLCQQCIILCYCYNDQPCKSAMLQKALALYDALWSKFIPTDQCIIDAYKIQTKGVTVSKCYMIHIRNICTTVGISYSFIFVHHENKSTRFFY